MNDADKAEVVAIVGVALKEALAFGTPKYGDTPTDAYQLTPKKYVTSLFAGAATVGGTNRDIQVNDSGSLGAAPDNLFTLVQDVSGSGYVGVRVNGTASNSVFGLWIGDSPQGTGPYAITAPNYSGASVAALDLVIRGSNTSNGFDAGDINIEAGSADGGGVSGDVTITAGTGSGGGDGADVAITYGIGSVYGNVTIGGAVPTTMAGGHVYLPACEGAPTGAPAEGAMIIDKTNFKLFYYSGSAWKSITFT